MSQKNADIIRKLVKLLKRRKLFPARIGTEESSLFCVDKGAAYRVSSAKGSGFPTAAIMKRLGATEAELLEALRWVTGMQTEQFGESRRMFWAFVPKDKKSWPKVPRQQRPRARK